MCYVYTLFKDGTPRERLGHIVKRGERYHLIEIGNQRICLPSKPQKIHNDSMWATVSMKNLYVEKMLDLMMDRRQKHIEAIQSIDRRMNKLKEGFER